MSNNFPFLGSERGLDLLGKIRALNKPENGPASDKDVIGWLYKTLSILDAKANGLLGVNGFFITVLSIFLGLWNAGKIPSTIPDIYGNISVYILGIFVLSGIFCFLIIRVKWKFLGKVQVSNGASYDFDIEIMWLVRVVSDRTHLYWIGWALTFLGFVSLMLGVLALGVL